MGLQGFIMTLWMNSKMNEYESRARVNVPQKKHNSGIGILPNIIHPSIDCISGFLTCTIQWSIHCIWYRILWIWNAQYISTRDLGQRLPLRRRATNGPPLAGRVGADVRHVPGERRRWWCRVQQIAPLVATGPEGRIQRHESRGDAGGIAQRNAFELIVLNSVSGDSNVYRKSRWKENAKEDTSERDRQNIPREISTKLQKQGLITLYHLT